MASVVTETKSVEESTPPYRRDETRHLQGTRHQGSNASSCRPYRAVATRHISVKTVLISLVKTVLIRYGTDVPREGQPATKHDAAAFAIC